MPINSDFLLWKVISQITAYHVDTFNRNKGIQESIPGYLYVLFAYSCSETIHTTISQRLQNAPLTMNVLTSRGDLGYQNIYGQDKH